MPINELYKLCVVRVSKQENRGPRKFLSDYSWNGLPIKFHGPVPEGLEGRQSYRQMLPIRIDYSGRRPVARPFDTGPLSLAPGERDKSVIDCVLEFDKGSNSIAGTVFVSGGSTQYPTRFSYFPEVRGLASVYTFSSRYSPDTLAEGFLWPAIEFLKPEELSSPSIAFVDGQKLRGFDFRGKGNPNNWLRLLREARRELQSLQ